MYRVLADWYHFAIPELTFVEDFNSDPAWIADELGITVPEAERAIERLLQFDLLRREGGKLVRTQAQLASANQSQTTEAARKTQRAYLEKAIISLEADDIDARSMTTMTMAIDPKRVPLAKKMIREFNQSMCATLERGRRQKVYNLCIALYPLQRRNQ